MSLRWKSLFMLFRCRFRRVYQCLVSLAADRPKQTSLTFYVILTRYTNLENQQMMRLISPRSP